MAETAITAVLWKLGVLATSEARVLLQVGNDMVLLRDRLEWLHAFVCDADDRRRRSGTDGLTRVWVRQTRDVAFEAEDALDDFFYHEVMKRQGYCRCRKILHRYFTCFITQIVVRHGLSGRMKSIKIRLEQISQNQREYNIQHTPTVTSPSSTTAIGAWQDDLENAVGFNEDVEILLHMLRNDQMFIISILGDSGAGKNTLAKTIRREMVASPETQVFVWYHMEPGCSTEGLINQLLTRARGYKHDKGGGISMFSWPNDEYRTESYVGSNVSLTSGDQLYEFLVPRRYLLILGGISSKSILNSVMASLPDNGGRVILILDTENEEIAWHANTMNMDGKNGVHLLPRLDQGRTGQLFYWKVLRKGQYEEVNNPKESGYLRLVHHITRGNPMAIVLLAGLLRFKEKPAQWDAVLQQLKSDCETQGRQANLCGPRRAMEIIFWTIFEDLTNDLKSCFLYFTAFPRKFSHPADNIVRMWIAEGFIKQPEDGKTMEELGHEYLKDLVLRCLVELEELNADGGIKLVRVHKSIMELLRSEAREAGFMDIQNTDDTGTIPPSVRRLSLYGANSSRYTSTFANKKFPKLRSFICHIMMMQRHKQEFKFLRWSRFIRVISIQGLNIEKLPHEIGDMINLRYLCIGSTNLSKIPSSIVRLLNLQTLDITRTRVSEIDKNFWKIKTLRHVLAGILKLPTTVPLVLSEDGGCRELQTLYGVQLDTNTEWSEGNCPLDNMPNLRSLTMYNFNSQRHGGTALRSALKRMHLLGHLYIYGDEIPSYVLTHPNLRSLQTMVLRGDIKWDDVIKELPLVDRPLRMVRPNLIQLKMFGPASSGIPQSIKEQLEGILIQR